MKTFWRKDEGTVVFSVIGICVTMAIITATVLVVAQLSAKVQHLSSANDEAYWMARGGVRQTLLHFQGASRPPEQTSWSLPDGQLSIFVQYQTLWDVRATAVTRDAVVTVLCSYDPRRHTVVHWQENAPTR